MAVMLSAAKHLVFSATYEDEILRPSPQDDIATPSCEGKGRVRLKNESHSPMIFTNTLFRRRPSNSP